MNFLLLVFPDGRTMLTSREALPDDSLRRVDEAFKEWWDNPNSSKPLIITGCDVVFAEEIEIDLNGTEGIQRRHYVPSEANQPATSRA